MIHNKSHNHKSDNRSQGFEKVGLHISTDFWLNVSNLGFQLFLMILFLLNISFSLSNSVPNLLYRLVLSDVIQRLKGDLEIYVDAIFSFMYDWVIFKSR